MKKILKLLLCMLCAFNVLTVANVFAESSEVHLNTKIVTNEVNIESLEIGKEVIIYEDGETMISVELTDIKNVMSRSSGDSGWSGGSIPWGISTLNVKCSHEWGYMQYKIDVRGSDSSIQRAYNLTYSVGLWTVQNTNVSIGNKFATNYSPAYATATINANLIQYGIVIGSFGGYLTSEVNSNGQFRVTYSF